MQTTTETDPLQTVQNLIYELRGHQVMMDFHLAEMYGVQTKRLKEQVRRNIERFPEDFMFELTRVEWNELVAICDQFPQNIKHSYVLPYAFTQEGVAMLSGVLRTPLSIEINIGIMRAFVKVRKYLAEARYSQHVENRLNKLEVANEELLKDMNDLSEDTRKALDDVFDVFARLSNEVQVTKEKSPLPEVGYTAERYKNKK